MTSKIAHVITGLDVGGAETALFKLLSRCDRTRFDPVVISLTSVGPIGDRIRALGIPVFALHIRSAFSAVPGVIRLAALLRANRVGLIQTWMYHADLLGGVVGAIAGRIPVVWGIRQSSFDPRSCKRSTVWIARLCGRLSRWIPTAILACSVEARRLHVDIGYDPSIEVIPNGFDLEQLKPDPGAKDRLRAELGIPVGSVVVGLVARFDPQKGHDTFLRAAGLIALRFPDVHFVLCGTEVVRSNARLLAWITDAGIREKCHLLGPRGDIEKITPGFDIAVSASTGEGFSNTVGEAMACGVPCAVTDVGDSAETVGETGQVAPARDPEALAKAIGALIEAGAEGRKRLGVAARRRIAERYELGVVVGRYEDVYERILSKERLNRCAV